MTDNSRMRARLVMFGGVLAPAAMADSTTSSNWAD
jgi:hypothetical protein